MSATIEFSAQFGGREAASAALPHFHTLKAVARTCSIPEFPFKSLAFILRVDGEVNAYGLSGLGNLDFDGENYVSLDIGLGKDDYSAGSRDLVGPVAVALEASADFLKASGDERLQDVDFAGLATALNHMSDSYKAMMAKGDDSTAETDQS